jgi:hypothetical protein
MQICALVLISSIAAYISWFSLGGIYIFGPRIRNAFDFCFIFMPFFALPVALVGWWKPRVAAVLWTMLIFAFFLPQMVFEWPRLHFTPVAGSHLQLFLIVEGLLLLLAIAEARSKTESYRKQAGEAYNGAVFVVKKGNSGLKGRRADPYATRERNTLHEELHAWP